MRVAVTTEQMSTENPLDELEEILTRQQPAPLSISCGIESDTRRRVPVLVGRASPRSLKGEGNSLGAPVCAATDGELLSLGRLDSPRTVDPSPEPTSCMTAFRSKHPPTFACFPNGLVCAALTTVCFLSLSAATEGVYFVVDTTTVETVTVTLWSVTRSTIQGVPNTTIEPTASLFPSCSDDRITKDWSVLQTSAVAACAASFLGALLCGVDGSVVALPRFVVVSPMVALQVASVVRWIFVASVVHRTEYCAKASLYSQGFYLTASLTTNVVTNVLTPLCLLFYFGCYAFHHQPLRQQEPSEEQQLAREPLVLAVIGGALLAV